MTSLPVPDSPVRSTVASVAATLAACVNTWRHGRDEPTIPSWFGAARALRSWAMPSRIAFSRSSSANGFVRNPSAPALIARTDVGMSPWPVRKMIGILISALASSRWRSSPFNPGRCTSRTRQLGTSARGLARNSCADANVRPLNPAERIRLSPASRTDASSSTTYTEVSFVFIRKPLPRPVFLRAQRRIDRFEKSILTERLAQVRDGAISQRPRACALVGSVRRYENDRNVTLARRELTLELKPTHPGHPHIENQAVGLAELLRIRELLGRRECLHAQTERADQAAQGLADRLIVIDNRNQRC